MINDNENLRIEFDRAYDFLRGYFGVVAEHPPVDIAITEESNIPGFHWPSYTVHLCTFDVHNHYCLGEEAAHVLHYNVNAFPFAEQRRLIEFGVSKGGIRDERIEALVTVLSMGTLIELIGQLGALAYEATFGGDMDRIMREVQQFCRDTNFKYKSMVSDSTNNRKRVSIDEIKYDVIHAAGYNIACHLFIEKITLPQRAMLLQAQNMDDVRRMLGEELLPKSIW